MENQNLLFQLAGHLTLLRIDDFMDDEEWNLAIKLIRKELERIERDMIDSHPSDDL